jgi:hypothetical protein
VRGLGFHPQAGWPSHLVRRCERYESIGSRTDLPHCVPMRKFGTDGARDWLHLSNRGDHRDHQAPEPLVASAPSSDIPIGPPCRSPLKPEASTRFRVQRRTNLCFRDFGLRQQLQLLCSSIYFCFGQTHRPPHFQVAPWCLIASDFSYRY